MKVIGVSLDNMDSHKAFAEKNRLNFPLLTDDDGKIAASFGVATDGGYARRVTFVVGPEQTIVNVFPEVDVRAHAAEVLEAVKPLVGK